MTIRINVLDRRPDEMPRAGDAWPLQEGEPFANASLQYRRDWAGKRRPLVLKLPDETELNVDAATTGDGLGHDVTGEHDGEGLSISGVLTGRTGRTFRVLHGRLEEFDATAPAPVDEETVSIR